MYRNSNTHIFVNTDDKNFKFQEMFMKVLSFYINTWILIFIALRSLLLDPGSYIKLDFHRQNI